MQVKITASKAVNVRNYAEASAACRAHLDKTGIGNSRWSGGALYEGGVQVGYVSYNGRVWSGDARSWKPGMTPLFDPRPSV